jgi:hypothetical protein
MRFLGSLRSRRAIAVTGVGALAALGLAACVPPGGGGNVVEFECTGAPETWTVPAGAGSLTFELFGAQGGAGSGDVPGGLGGKTTLTASSANPGETLQINVGCSGDSTAGPPGFPAGGQGGELLLGSGGTGGGHSDVRAQTPDGFIPFLVAGGGGGGGCTQLLGTGGPGGQGGGAEGTAGEDGTLLGIGSIGVVGGGGGAGKQQASGFGGEGTERGTLDGAPGDLLEGGNGGGTTLLCGGGGGGSGLFGGGGGGASIAGGGGGGGGSGAGAPGTSPTLEPGVREGDGLVRITIG